MIVNYSGSGDHAREPFAAIQRQRGTAIAAQANASNVADIDRLFATAIEHFGRLHIVVANAGLN
jgi:NAD(P)-dependent dehydrogenase (short-subunit alcohol dehydrogenase family)